MSDISINTTAKKIETMANKIIDNISVEDSQNLITSGAVYEGLSEKVNKITATENNIAIFTSDGELSDSEKSFADVITTDEMTAENVSYSNEELECENVKCALDTTVSNLTNIQEEVSNKIPIISNYVVNNIPKEISDGEIADSGISINDVTLKSDVLTKTNTTEFTPTGDYQPSTKKYVDEAAMQSPRAKNYLYNFTDLKTRTIQPTPFTEASTVMSYSSSIEDLTLTFGYDIILDYIVQNRQSKEISVTPVVVHPEIDYPSVASTFEYSFNGVFMSGKIEVEDSFFTFDQILEAFAGQNPSKTVLRVNQSTDSDTVNYYGISHYSVSFSIDYPSGTTSAEMSEYKAAIDEVLSVIDSLSVGYSEPLKNTDGTFIWEG